MQNLPTPQGLDDMQQESLKKSQEQEKNRKLIIDLGRFFEATIDDFIKSQGDVPGTAVTGAANYIINLYKERMVTLMEDQSRMYGALKKKVDEAGLKIHEPFSNDGLDGHAWADPGQQKPGILVPGRDQ